MKINDIIEGEVIDLAFGGKGIMRYENLVVFVDGALPGQIIKAKISKKKKSYAEAKIVEIIKNSDLEIENDYQAIPGAPWANLPVEIQQKYKKAQVLDLFQKNAKCDIEPFFQKFIEDEHIWDYRNKMEFSFGPTHESYDEETGWTHHGFGLGSKKRGQFWLVEHLEKPSGLFDTGLEKFLPVFAEFLQQQFPEKKAYNSRTQKGFFRGLMIRKTRAQNGFLFNLTTKEDDTFDIQKVVDFWTEKLGDRCLSFYWSQGDDTSDAGPGMANRKCVYGQKNIMETLTVGEKTLEFSISVDSFFQPNPRTAEKLYETVASLVQYGENGGRVLDLFCGTGTIAQVVASQKPQAKVMGIEIVRAAAADARTNANRNNLGHIKFIAEDVSKFLKGACLEEIDTILLDPPRAGIAPKSLKRILDAKPKEIVYVSCNPATLTRDTAQVLEADYRITDFYLVDQFPHTAHVESVIRFEQI